jgi:hypothetical protein
MLSVIVMLFYFDCPIGHFDTVAAEGSGAGNSAGAQARRSARALRRSVAGTSMAVR